MQFSEILKSLISFFTKLFNFANKNQKLLSDLVIEAKKEIQVNNLKKVSDNPYNSDFLTIPQRNANQTYLSGSEFVQTILNKSGTERENLILQQFEIGNIPDFMRNPIEINIKNLTYLVLPDYLCVGSDVDFVRVPLYPTTAQKIADLYNCVLPTSKMVDDIYINADVKLNPQPNGPPYDQTMELTSTFYEHNKKINLQLNPQEYGKLIAGHKKDIILTNKLAPNNINKRVAIYGWHKDNKNPIQPINAASHSVSYCDYSHGLRLISKTIFINQKPMDINLAFDDAELCKLLNNDGILKFKKY